MLGRDPLTEPLTSTEKLLFISALEWHFEAEMRARSGADPIGFASEGV